MTPTKALELLHLILKGDNPEWRPDYKQAIRMGIDALADQMLEVKGEQK